MSIRNSTHFVVTATKQIRLSISKQFHRITSLFLNTWSRFVLDMKVKVTFVCGYEAGCLGYSLYHQLRDHAVDCKILAPSTMAVTNTHHVKTDKRDAANIARCLAFHTYSEVYVPDNDDNDVKEYIRMRDDQKLYLKKLKQQILAFVLRQGKH
ncbi:transposase [bacterium 210820-DFI.6.37]|nr:transposase [bacterium 210820-DFI.6.37]